MTQAVTDLLLDIASEKNGYQIAEPWRFTEFSLAAIVPILRQTEVERAYRLLSEAGDEVDIRDTGEISKVEVKNNGSVPVLMKSGELVAGSTQTRTIAMSQVVMPGTKVTARCFCAYSSKPINTGEQVAFSGYSPPEVRRHIYRGAVTPSFSSQEEVWASINDYSMQMAQSGARFMAAGSSGMFSDTGGIEFTGGEATSWNTPSDDLAGRITEAEDKFKEALKHVPEFENQVGMALLSIDNLDSLESFEHPGSWKALRESILKAEAGKIADVDQDSVFQYKAEKAKAAVRELLTSQFEESVGVAKEATMTVILQASKFTGEVVTLYGEPIHCSFVRN